MSVDLKATFHDPTVARRKKTVCTGAVLGFFGISASKFRYCMCTTDVKRIFRNNGFAVRSRLSKFKKAKTIGQLRREICEKADEGRVVWSSVGVPGHALLLNNNGEPVVDTDPRQRDARRIVHVSAIYKMT